MQINLAPAVTPASIVTSRKKMTIPIYQRPFVWKEEQIDKLLKDLWDARDGGKDYYLGVITVHENNEGQWEIVDGQQRLTFLTLLGCLFIRNRGDSVNQDWYGFVKWNEAELRLDFHGRSEDREAIIQFLGNPKEPFTKRSFARFADCFKCFSISKGNEDIQQFASFCFSHAAFLVNELPCGYGPQELNLYFEKMNSTGRQLSPIEVVKGRWFGRFALWWNACLNFDKTLNENLGNNNAAKQGSGYAGTEKSLQDVIDGKVCPERETDGVNETVATSRLLIREDMLALHVLKKLYPDIPLERDKLLATFNEKFKGRATDEAVARPFLEELDRYRRWMDENIIYLKEDGTYAFRSDSRLDEDELERDSTRKKLLQFQAMLYVSSSETQEWILSVYTNNQGGRLTYEALRRWDASNHKEDSLEEQSLRFPNVLRYWFWKLDYLLWEINEEKKATLYGFSTEDSALITKYAFRRNRSREHFHPQAKEGGGWGQRNDVDAPMHHFGNLAMISLPENSALSDDAIEIKIGRVQSWIREGRGVESIKLLLMFRLSEKSEKGWIPDVAHEHGEAMRQLLADDQKQWGGSSNGVDEQHNF